ncbi:hypothetical protein PIL02S_00839 [Paenibacillus illinoisensis]|uniref:Uncharacterized protein n=1 Tax=Paenibacillus illinoisensis TaxID=59845 RepID=A0A2W0CD92_9BACL|nr:hypothetical protein PIL02S_00839 [Paenibacillus illinoisensis]
MILPLGLPNGSYKQNKKHILIGVIVLSWINPFEDSRFIIREELFSKKDVSSCLKIWFDYVLYYEAFAATAF